MVLVSRQMVAVIEPVAQDTPRSIPAWEALRLRLLATARVKQPGSLKCAETTIKRMTAAVWGAVAAAVDVLKVQRTAE